jgi:hypothetical protein
VAAFVILTEPFGDQVERMMTFQPTDRPLPAVVIGHPMQNISDEALQARAVQIADAAQRLLDGQYP